MFHVVAHFELCFLHSISYFFGQSEPFLGDIIFRKYGPPLPAPHTLRSSLELQNPKYGRSASGSEMTITIPSIHT